MIEKTYSQQYEALAKDIRKTLRGDKVTITILVREGLTISTAINFMTREVKEYDRFMACSVYDVCVILDKLEGGKSYTKRFKAIFDDKHILLNRWAKELRHTPNISNYVANAYRLKRFTRKKKYRFGAGTMLGVLDKAQELEWKEQESHGKKTKRN